MLWTYWKTGELPRAKWNTQLGKCNIDDCIESIEKIDLVIPEKDFVDSSPDYLILPRTYYPRIGKACDYMKCKK